MVIKLKSLTAARMFRDHPGQGHVMNVCRVFLPPCGKGVPISLCRFIPWPLLVCEVEVGGAALILSGCRLHLPTAWLLLKATALTRFQNNLSPQALSSLLLPAPPIAGSFSPAHSCYKPFINAHQLPCVPWGTLIDWCPCRWIHQ